ncbi:rho GDP-dissociation inhibitor [Peniophora sp. CONT]|nr:rho GDP-dissociation inhibitor [Peniophora sp. CONT]
MSAPADDEFEQANTPGYKPSAAKSVDEYKNLDANDDSLARWKASLGLTGDAYVGDTSKPRLTVSYLELESSKLPAGKSLKMDISTPQAIAKLKESPIQVKEGADYKMYITFNVNHGIVTGARYAQVVKRTGVTVNKENAMIGSFSAAAEPRRILVVEDEFPSGMLTRSSYSVKSRVNDFDGGIFAEWDWVFKIAKDWA